MSFLFQPLGTEKFDAPLVILQILLVQTTLYLVQPFVLFLFNVILFTSMPTKMTIGKDELSISQYPTIPHLDQMFSYRTFSIFSRIGWSTLLSWLVCCLLFGSLCLFFFIRRSKRCLDFVATFFIFHFLFTLIYNGFPIHWEWWVCMTICAGGMELLGESICYWRESRSVEIKSHLQNIV